jgi:hypothetical protein
MLKAYDSILFIKNGFKNADKSYKNPLRRNNYEEHVCIAVQRCFPNILDAVVIENINLSEGI